MKKLDETGWSPINKLQVVKKAPTYKKIKGNVGYMLRKIRARC